MLYSSYFALYKCLNKPFLFGNSNMKGVVLLTIISLLAITGCTYFIPNLNETITIPEIVMSNLTDIDAINQRPEDIEQSDLPKKTITEGDLVNFPHLQAQDPDNDNITFSFTPPLNATGQWQTKDGDAGSYKVTISVSDGTHTVSQDVLIIVTPRNKPPIIEMPSKLVFNSGETVKLAPGVVDPEGADVKITYSGWMTSNSKDTTNQDVGEHIVEIKATDGVNFATQSVKITINKMNHAPQLADIENIEAIEGELLKLEAQATDPDQDEMTLTYTEPFNYQGEWQTKLGDAGEYKITINASDGNLSTIKEVLVKVIKKNLPPTINAPKTITANEGETILLDYSVEDPDQDEIKTTQTGWMTTTEKQLNYNDAGKYSVEIIAVDSKGNTAVHVINIEVNDVNRPPQFNVGSFE